MRRAGAMPASPAVSDTATLETVTRQLPKLLTAGETMTEAALKAGVFRAARRGAARRANLRCTGPHILRHTFCSHLAMRDVASSTIQTLAGHSDLSTTERYVHVLDEVLTAAIRRLETPGTRPAFGEIVETDESAIDN